MLSTIRPGRTKALVQRHRRKAHVASIGVGEQTWLTACNRTLPVDATGFMLLAVAVDQIDTTDLCLYCASLYATADIFYDRGYTAGYAAALQEQAR
jgi:hypothetical protein